MLDGPMRWLHRFVTIFLLATSPVLQAQNANNVYSKVAPSVGIVIVTTFEGQLVATGSAVTVASQTMITNQHVLVPGHRYQVLVNGARHEAYMTSCDNVQDLCLLSVSGLEARPVEFADADRLSVGDTVYAIGAPNEIRNVLGVTAATKQKSYTPLQLTLSNGLITALRPVEGGNVIQTNAAISPGSSGGGLFDTQGRLVGITTFVMRNAQGVGMALPVNWVERLGVSGAPRNEPVPTQLTQSPLPTPREAASSVEPPVASQLPDEAPAAPRPRALDPITDHNTRSFWLAAPILLLALLLWRRSRRSTSNDSDDDSYIDPQMQEFIQQAARELDEQKPEAALWSIVISDHKGNMAAARTSYIQRRAARLLSAEKDRKWAEAARQAT